MKNKLLHFLRYYIYIAMAIKLFFVVRQFIVTGQINYLLGELVAWTIILVSPVCDYLLEHKDD